MFQTFDPNSIQAPACLVALNLVVDRSVTEKAADRSPFRPPASVDLDLIGDRGPTGVVVECGGALKQPAAVHRPQSRGVAAGPVEPCPCREFAQPRASVTG